MNHILANWKTSLAGLLSFLIVTLTTIVGFMGANDVNNVGTLQNHTKYLAYANVALALCRAWVGFLQMDAGKVPALIPGQPGIQMVPAHEIPDDPTAKVVVPASNKP